jgi:hypothetical protein
LDRGVGACACERPGGLSGGHLGSSSLAVDVVVAAGRVGPLPGAAGVGRYLDLAPCTEVFCLVEEAIRAPWLANEQDPCWWLAVVSRLVIGGQLQAVGVAVVADESGIRPVPVGGHGVLQHRGGLVQVGGVAEEPAAERDRVAAAERPGLGDGAVVLRDCPGRGGQ